MPVGIARQLRSESSLVRGARSLPFVAALLVLGSTSLQDAVADGETRTLSMHHLHTGENITITYKRNGRYDQDALKKINWFLRDWRRQKDISMDPQLLDVIWEVNQDVDGKQPVDIVCGYRSPETNSMLRRRSRGVARMSQHMLGKAIDFYIPGVPLEKIRVAGLRLQRGGVGYYPSSGSPFVHLDVGSIRHWPRMTREQLVRVFPDGRTVHVPTDGKPLKNYALALADIERRGETPSALSLAQARDAGVNIAAATKTAPNFFAKLLGLGKDKDEDEDTVAETTPAQTPAGRPRETTKLASAERVPTPRARPVRTEKYALASVSTAEISAARSLLAERLNAVPKPAQPQPRLVWQAGPAGQIRPSLPAVEPAAVETTASVSPWHRPSATPNDRVPADIALAYAAEAPVTQPLTAMPPEVPRTVAAPLAAAIKASLPIARLEQSYDSPWLRGLTLTASVRETMSVETFGPVDYRAAIAPLMHKPSSSLALVFSADPYLGLADRAFRGTAIAFMPTITFGVRTASLQ